MLRKQEIREDVKDKKANLTANQISKASQEILKYLKTYLINENTNAVHIYNSLHSLKEPETTPIIKWFKRSNPSIKIFVPTVDQNNKNNKSTIRNIFGLNRLVFPDERVMLENDEINVFLLPLVAFDTNGNRLGHGGGFYDKLLYCYPEAKKIGLAFDLQKVDSVPTEAHDIKLDAVITETQIYRC